MREDQRIRLEEINERLVDVLLDEADPDNWPGAGILPADMSKEDRGDRYWSKKNAAMTTVLIADNMKLLVNTKEALGRDPLEAPEMDDVIDRAEQKAAKRLKEIAEKTGHAAFADRTYGKTSH